MSLALRLRAALVLLALLLLAVVTIQAVALRDAVASQRALVALSARLRLSDHVQPLLLDDMRRSARKFVVTRDSAYLRELARASAAFDSTLGEIGVNEGSAEERAAVVTLTGQWKTMDESRRVGESAHSLREAIAAATRTDTIAGSMLPTVAALSRATRASIASHTARSERRSHIATALGLGASCAALGLALFLSVALVRSIVRPLDRLAIAANAVASGQLDHRVPVSGTDELGRLARTFNAMTARLAEVDRMKRDFVSNVSHDLKTPLSSMQEATDALLEGLAGPVSDKQRQLLTYHRESGLRLASMLAKLLDLSRLEARDTTRRELMDLTGLVRRAVDHVRTAREGRPALPTVELLNDDTRIALRADAEGVAQVLDNLLENALKFSPSDGCVRVGLRYDRGDAVLTVADEGPGVPDAEKEHIFERFHQTDAGRAVASRGVGLGLAICRHVVQAHDGRISVRDNTPCGAIFEVRFPDALVMTAAGVERASRETVAM